MYKELAEVEDGFRQMKDVLELRPIYHQCEHRVRAHVFVAALALLVQTLLKRRLIEKKVDLSAKATMQAMGLVKYVRFKIGDEESAGVG